MSSAIAISADKQNIFFALEDGGGLPMIVKTQDLATFSVAYQPGAGTAANVIAMPDDEMLFFGNFGTDVGIILHTISTGTNTDITPAGLGASVVNAAWVNPNDGGEIWITISTAQDLLKSVDGGTNWTTQENALGLDPTALVVFDTNKVLVAGNTGAQTNLLYAEDDGATFTDIANTTLHAVANITALAMIE